MICQNFFGYCPLPPTSPLNMTGWFAKPKPSPLPAPKAPSGKRLKVLHVSDMHLDARTYLSFLCSHYVLTLAWSTCFRVCHRVRGELHKCLVLPFE